MSHAHEIVEFWREAGHEKWFGRDEAFDRRFDEHFRDLHFRAARRELEDWIDHAESALALILLLDQFPRNSFRGSAHSYATDGLARHYAERSIAARHDEAIAMPLRMFFYMPYEHSECIEDQRRALELFAPLANEEATRYAQLHHDLIARFGRFPHRNPALGRISTQEEIDYLAEGGFSG